MSVTVLCPNLSCKAILHAPDTMRGQMIRCGQCGTYLTVPSERLSSSAVKAARSGAGGGDSGKEGPPAKKKGKGRA